MELEHIRVARKAGLPVAAAATWLARRTSRAFGTVMAGLTLALALAVSPAQGAPPPPPSITSFAASAGTVTIPGSLRLTATLSGEIYGTGYAVRIVDDDTGQALAVCQVGTTCSAPMTTSWADNANPRSRHFHAELYSGGVSSAQSAQITVSVLPYIFAVALSTSASQVTVPDSVQLTATASRDVYGTGYALRIVDDDSGQLLASCQSGTSCTAPVRTSWADNATPHARHFHAEVRSTNGPAGQSAQVVVSIRRYIFTVALSAGATQVTVPDSLQLTATTNRDVYGTGYALRIVDDDSGQAVAVCQSGTTCAASMRTAWADNAHPGTRHFHAEVQGAGGPYGQSAALTVNVRRFLFNVSLALAPDHTDATGQAFFRATATTDRDVWGTGYGLAITDSRGSLLAYCRSGTTCAVVVPSGNSYQADVDDGGGGTFGTSATWTIGPSGPQNATADGISAVGASALFAGPSDACDALLLFPGTHTQDSSLSDQQLACEAATRNGASTVDAIAAAAAAGGTATAASVYWWLLHQGTVAVPAFNPFPGTSPQDATAPSATLPTVWPVSVLAAELTARNADLSQTVADAIAKQCLWAESLSAANGLDECGRLPIFVSGDDVGEAAESDLQALTSTPQWVKLNYRPAADNPSRPRWYRGKRPCSSPTPEGQNCHEYPFYATQQGGGAAVPTPALRYIDGSQNQLQGTWYNTKLVVGCALRSGSAFLAIPMPDGLVPSTTAICNQA